MKLVCTVSVCNRLQSTIPIKLKNKYVKSTLAICKHPKNEDESMIIHFTAQNKTGVKYKLLNNVSNILTRFIHEGKATIQFKEPALDFFIQSDIIQLKAFLHLLKRILERKVSAKELTLSSVSVTPAAQPPKKLVIKKRSELPIKGFPRTLESLHINEIHLAKLCVGVLQLQNLRVLNISDNNIEYLPTELKKLPLEQLDVSKNDLGKGILRKHWNWIDGTLQNTLRILNISFNNLNFVPYHIIKLKKLRTLNMNHNNLKTLPCGIGKFKFLHTLLMANNKLVEVPGSITQLQLETCDISNNNFLPMTATESFLIRLPVLSLREYAARKVLDLKTPYDASIIPHTLVDYLDFAHYCVCGKACFENYLKYKSILLLNVITKCYSTSATESGYVPMLCYYCTVKCFKNKHLVYKH